MLLDSNILIYGADGGELALDVILDRTDLSLASVSRIETLGFHGLDETERTWLNAAIGRMKVLPLNRQWRSARSRCGRSATWDLRMRSSWQRRWCTDCDS